MYRFFILLAVACATDNLLAEKPSSDQSPQRLSQIRADIEFLASEDLRGRSSADETIQVAAEYIADRMEGIGLETSLFDGTPMQPFQIPLGPRAGDKEENRVEFSFGDKPEKLSAELGEGMRPLSIGSAEGSVKGPVVFAGYGITAPEFDYDDYKGINVAGATVIVIRKEPEMNDPSSRFKGTENTRHAYFATKIENAVKHGATAMILVNDPTSVLGDVQNEKSKIAREQQRKAAMVAQIEKLPEGAANNRKTIREKIVGIDTIVASMQADLDRAKRGVLPVGVAGPRSPRKKGLPVASVGRDVVTELLEKTLGKSLSSLEKAIDETKRPQSEMLAKTSVSLQVKLKPSYATTSNVVGTIPGKGELEGETIVLGAHYDHVGMGGYGSLAPGTIAVHNGADDNASGTSALLSAAELLAESLRDVASHRRMVFIAFSGEERGLLGSKHYVRNARFPIDQTAAMINMDMVGRLKNNELTVYGTGSADTLDGILEEANVKGQFNLFKVASGYGPSDHQSFYVAGVPVLFFFTGLHNDYHRPSDDFDKIDFGGMARITDTVSDVAFQLAIRKDRPKYAETEKRVEIRRQP